MAITNFIPEIWHAQLLASLKKNLVYAGPGVVNRDYEGDIRERGDTVHIVSISAPTIATYTAHTDITTSALTDADRTLVIDQAKYFSFELDDLERAQAQNGGALMSEAASETAYGLSDAADSYVAGLIKTDVDSGNALGAQAVSTSTLAVQLLIDLKVTLDEANVPNAGRYVVITPALHGKLLGDDRFVRADASGSTEALRNGMVGRAFGFDVLISNNAPAGASTGKIITAGYPGAVSYAEQVNKVEAFRLEKRFSDGLKGLHLYGAKVVRPTGVATADVTVS